MSKELLSEGGQQLEVLAIGADAFEGCLFLLVFSLRSMREFIVGVECLIEEGCIVGECIVALGDGFAGEA